MLKEYSIYLAFIAGLAHVFEPCEDKAIVSVYVAWAGENFRDTLKLILLYGFGMMAINILIGLGFSFVGARYLNDFQEYLVAGAGIFTIIFGLLIIYHSHLFGNRCFLEHHHNHNFDVKSKKSVLTFGLLRGLPLCPVELAIMLWAASSGSILKGVALVAAFSFGTIISLIPFGIGARGIFKFLDKKIDHRTKQFIQLGIGLVVVAAGVVSLIYVH
ncbi:MAG: sulfite exporter TauE/SafE family protein [bacterium]